MLSPDIIKSIEEKLSQGFGKPVSLEASHHIGGGCINRAARMSTSAGDFFVKLNDAKLYPRMFEAEAKGLALLASARAIKVPEVIVFGEAQEETFIILEFIRPAARARLFWENFGRSLSNLHRNTASQFGLNHDNYIGSLPQSNRQHDDWISFFIRERLQKQVHLASESKLLTSKHLQQFEKLYTRLPGLLPQEPPALLHGDLWSGNFLTGPDGEACLIDPAVYYGHREMELAFTQLFGGFDARFYTAYHETFPLQPGFEQRKDVYNLYPLLVHLNLFGESYLSGVEGRAQALSLKNSKL